LLLRSYTPNAASLLALLLKDLTKDLE